MSSLNTTASWVIIEKETNKVIVETYSNQTIGIIQRNYSSRYKAVPILQYLQEFNKGVQHDI